MATKHLEMNGYYKDEKIVEMDNGHIIDLSQLSNKTEIPSIPYGTKVEVIIKYDAIDFLNGTNGIVWATYNYIQADTIKNSLFVQNIYGRIRESELVTKTLFKIYIPNIIDIKKAIDFIWKDRNGMRLDPDWHYPVDS